MVYYLLKSIFILSLGKIKFYFFFIKISLNRQLELIRIKMAFTI